MNFKLLIPLTVLLSSCGVKGPPRPPANTQVPAFTNSYLLKSDQASDQSSPSENKKHKKKKE